MALGGRARGTPLATGSRTATLNQSIAAVRGTRANCRGPRTRAGCSTLAHAGYRLAVWRSLNARRACLCAWLFTSGTCVQLWNIRQDQEVAVPAPEAGKAGARRVSGPRSSACGAHLLARAPASVAGAKLSPSDRQWVVEEFAARRRLEVLGSCVPSPHFCFRAFFLSRLEAPRVRSTRWPGTDRARSSTRVLTP